MFDIISDIHGCYNELKTLTMRLGYDWESGVPLHPEGRKLVFPGDITDRGKDSLAVVKIVSQLVTSGQAFYCPGNHCNKFYRYLIGRNVQQTHGLETTVAELNALPPKDRTMIKELFIALYENAPLYLSLDDGELIAAHAGIPEKYIGQVGKKVKTFVLYGDITGESHPNGMPIRKDWATQYEGGALIVYGHTPVLEPRWVNHTVNIDTGCVFGGKLTALSYPELKTTSVQSSMPYVAEKFTSFQ
ncbi:bis(5'-nucleosyl)-tetraphosphatase PrpE [Bacillus sp. N1-1]|uniref:bis(5'-nucleosyl)-tetraphosphatase PrpE n=1 Tax=Bacillus sp. N1-1 TaxID=2682541 RepID=UPI0013180D5A|nr:bis(5'-nucleosyl)-tetraphosphatase PrpE [Bacillus sp. N1-1]QHA91588.1 bis(5'-nucleosyl)-tetraphosphatase PrpE [Bacillus sp. N1-1]